MEENLFEKIPGLEKLLETKEFEDLTSREKEEILSFMSRKDYQNYRKTILKSRALFSAEQKNIKADPSIREKLLEKITQKKSLGHHAVFSVFQRILTFRIPAYQPGFAVVILAVLFILLHNEKTESIRYLTKTDTIYLEKEIAQTENTQKNPDSTLKNSKRNDAKETGRPEVRTVSGEEGRAEQTKSQYVQNAYQKIRMVNRIKNGSNASDDSALLKFLVTSN
jgi:hypothetical protein